MKYTFSCFRDEINGIFVTKNEFSFHYIYNFKRDRFFVLYDVIDVHTLRHINDDFA